MRNKRRIISTALIVTGLILLAGAGTLFFNNMIENNRFQEDSGELVSRVASGISEAQQTDIPDDTSASKEHEDMPDGETVEIDGEIYDGILTIPSIDLEMAVYDTWNEDLLRKSVCRYYGSAGTSDLVIAGHNYRSGFGKLKELMPGAEVFFTDASGTVYSYVVDETEVLPGTAVSEMIGSEWDMSLYTCTYGGRSRFTVRCRLSR
ncbi:MAG: sortase [Clostridiales bacterium]|nr:sortase [Clostridiales bacterium]